MRNLFSKKYMYLAGALLAGTTMFSSCSNDDEPAISNEKTLAKITMSMEGLPQTRQSANDVNKGETANDIENIVLVPIVNDTWLDAINLGELTASENTTQKYQSVAVGHGVNQFRVYGGEAAKVKAPITATTTFALEENGTEGTTSVYKPAGLYYYVETGKADASETNRNVTIKAEQTQQAAVDETTTDIAITGVRYGIGLLTTKVSASNSIKYVDETGSTTGTETTFSGDLTLTGVFVGSQPAKVDSKFEPIQETEDQTTLIVKDENIASGTIEKNDNASAVTTVNNYTTLFQTMPEEQAAVVLKLTSSIDIYAKNAGGTYEKVTAGVPFYVKTVLAPANATSGSQNALFQKYYETKANLKINSLANATTELPDITPTDIDLSVTVDLDWEEGFVFDETID